MLVDLPEDESVTLDDFVQMQEKAVADSTDHLKAKNMEVETAVEDLIALIKGYPLSPMVGYLHLLFVTSNFKILQYNRARPKSAHSSFRLARLSW